MEIHTAELVVPEPSAFEVEMAIEKLKTCESPGVYQIPAELIEAGGRTICSEICEYSNFIWNKEELLEQWKESVIAPIYKKSDQTDCSNLSMYITFVKYLKILCNILWSRLTPYAEEVVGDHQGGF
jgi:hypothetical protein